jgi:hypothetical protein
MRKQILVALFVGLFCCCSSSNRLDFNVIENTVYDAPVKSQVVLRLELKSAYTVAQLKELCESMVRISSEKEMKYHPLPTHVWIYIYKSKADFLKDGSSWIAMYQKPGSDKPGDYTYR